MKKPKVFDSEIFKGYRKRPVSESGLNATCSANIYLLKSNNRNARKRCEICSDLIAKTLERCQ